MTIFTKAKAVSESNYIIFFEKKILTYIYYVVLGYYLMLDLTSVHHIHSLDSLGHATVHTTLIIWLREKTKTYSTMNVLVSNDT